MPMLTQLAECLCPEWWLMLSQLVEANKELIWNMLALLEPAGLVVPLEVLGEDIGIQKELGHGLQRVGRPALAAPFLICDGDNLIQQGSVFGAAKEA